VSECPSCSTQNSSDARFCSNCGTSLATRVSVHERRVVTALFADLAHSTGLGEQLDPEVMRGIVGRFFELARDQVERRGGTVEKFSGDAVMAIYGLPAAHEDDPERAVRSALAIRQGMADLSADAQARHGTTIQARIGIETGEVVVGDPFGGATQATGDTLNVAARLEQLAQPDEIVLGPTAYAQLRDMVVAEPLGELSLRGRQAAAKAWRVLSIADEVGRPRGVPGLEAPLTGRDEELALLLEAARRARGERKAVLFTLLGVPGVGKSRLVREATARMVDDGWSVVRGRCLPYGEGITYWPVAEMLRSLAGIRADMSADDALAHLAQLMPASDVAEPLASALGLGAADEAGDAAGDREIAWGFRRLLEHLAGAGPQVLIFEDIHWAEPPLLDLIEYLATWVREKPLLLICPARPELLDRRQAWGSGRMEATRISLESLSDEESRALLAGLLDIDDLPADLRRRVLERAEGNPLFVEEMVRLLIEEGVIEKRGDRWVASAGAAGVRVPESVEALLRARLDTLPAAERSVLQSASVIGRVFQQSAVAAVSPPVVEGEWSGRGSPATAIERHLEEAVLRDLIIEERSPETDRTFRFRHVLIRDVAYGTLPKAHRARLHGLVADWLREWAGKRVDEFIEIEAHHLEQAVQLRRELDGQVDAALRARAVESLAAAARKALARDDPRALQGFAERALALDPEAGMARLELRALVVDALRMTDQFRAAAELGAAVEQEAAAIGRRDIEGRAILAQAGNIWLGLDSRDAPAAWHQLGRARDLLSEAGDDFYLNHTLELLGFRGWWLGDFDDAYTVWSEEREIARTNGWTSREADAVLRLSMIAGNWGELDRRRELLDEAARLAERGTSLLTRAKVKRARGGLFARGGPVDEGERLLLEVLPELDELGDTSERETAYSYLGEIELWRDRPSQALDYFSRARELVAEHAGRLPEAERHMAQALLALGEVEEAERLAEHAVEVTGKDDWATVASTRAVLGLVREAQGRVEQAEGLLRDACAIAGGTDFNPWEDELSLAEFLLRTGRLDEGREWLVRARANAARYGEESPVVAFVERRGAQAEAAGSRR
jgi:class 3 adenylate cyclase/tetratricopeptide (TPR) repeat protein